jgi:hypothetical protein
MNSISWSIHAGIRLTDCKQGLEYVEATPQMTADHSVTFVTRTLNDLNYRWQNQHIFCLVPAPVPGTCFTNSLDHHHLFGEFTLNLKKSYSRVLQGRRRGPQK